MNKLTGSLEDYIEVIYILEKRHGCCRITDIADYLNISKASATRAVNNLKSSNLLNHEKYGEISLTVEGLKIAKVIYEKHILLTNFFKDVLKISPKIAEEDACRIEHIISSETLEKLVEYANKNK